MSTENASNKKIVNLNDGTTAEFTEKQKMELSVTASESGVAFRAAFANGEVRTGTVPASLLLRAAEHGIGQKLRDSISGEKTIEDAVGSFEDVAETLLRGDWTQTRASGDGPKASKTELAQALAAVRGIAVEAAANWLATKTPAEKIKLRQVPAISLKIAEMRAAKTANTDQSDLFDGLPQ